MSSEELSEILGDEYQSEFTEDDFDGLSRDEKTDFMKDWFYENYEDPAERTPFESREGGYIYIWGGPYDAREELSIFSGLVEEDLIEELANSLSLDSFEWTRKENPEDYEDSYLDFIGTENESYSSFNNTINHIRQITDISTAGEVQSHLLGMLYVNVVTAMETYLSDVFVNEIISDRNNLVKFVECNPDYQDQTLKISEIFSEFSSIEKRVRGDLLGVMWHNLRKVKPMFKSSLNIDFPTDLGQIFKAVLTRHDLVHRGGKNKDGEVLTITKNELSDLVSCMTEFLIALMPSLYFAI